MLLLVRTVVFVCRIPLRESSAGDSAAPSLVSKHAGSATTAGSDAAQASGMPLAEMVVPSNRETSASHTGAIASHIGASASHTGALPQGGRTLPWSSDPRYKQTMRPSETQLPPQPPNPSAAAQVGAVPVPSQSQDNAPPVASVDTSRPAQGPGSSASLVRALTG